MNLELYYCNNYGRVISAKKDQKTIVFDISNNFIRNHNKFINEQNEGLKCFDFLKISDEENQFLYYSNTPKKNKNNIEVKKFNINDTKEILSVIMKFLPDTKKIKKGTTLSQIINEQINNEDLREEALDELFLKNIEMRNYADFDLGSGLEAIRTKIFEKNKDSKAVTGSLAKLKVEDLKDLGIVDFSDDGTTDNLINKRIINSEGFIVGGNIDGILGLNLFTGTELDGPEDDEMSIDYYGCRPKRDNKGSIIGWYDVAGYDRFGFNENGINNVTGQNFDERGFVKNKDGSWRNIYNGEKDVDLLGYNHEGINPKTGFDRDGYWHELQSDGTYSIAKTKYALSGELKGLDVHGFTKSGLYKGEKNKYKDDFGFYSNNYTTIENVENIKEYKYGTDGYDIDGFNKYGFNKDGINKYTATRFGPNGKDSSGKLDDRIQKARNLLERVLRNINKFHIECVNDVKDWNDEEKSMTPEEMGKRILDGMSYERIYSGISDSDPNSITSSLKKIMKNNENIYNEIFDFPVGIDNLTLKDIFDLYNKDVNKYSDFYHKKAKQAKEKCNYKMQKYYNELAQKRIPGYMGDSDDFVR